MSNTYVHTSSLHIFSSIVIFNNVCIFISFIIAMASHIMVENESLLKIMFQIGISNKTKAESSISIVNLREMAIHWINVWTLGFWCDRLHKQLIQAVSIPKRLLRAQLLAVCPSLTQKKCEELQSESLQNVTICV